MIDWLEAQFIRYRCYRGRHEAYPLSRRRYRCRRCGRLAERVRQADGSTTLHWYTRS